MASLQISPTMVTPARWRNRERVLDALIRKGLLDDDLKVTDAGRRYLPAVIDVAAFNEGYQAAIAEVDQLIAGQK